VFLALTQNASRSTDARLAASEYVVCDALDALRCTTRGAQGGLGNVGRDLADRMDLRQIRTSFGPRLDEGTHTLAALGDTLQTTETNVTLMKDDWMFALRLVAVADVDADGRSDWIISLTDEARTGSSRDYGVFVVLDPARPGPLHVQMWPPHPASPRRLLVRRPRTGQPRWLALPTRAPVRLRRHRSGHWQFLGPASQTAAPTERAGMKKASRRVSRS